MQSFLDFRCDLPADPDTPLRAHQVIGETLGAIAEVLEPASQIGKVKFGERPVGVHWDTGRRVCGVISGGIGRRVTGTIGDVV